MSVSMWWKLQHSVSPFTYIAWRFFTDIFIPHYEFGLEIYIFSIIVHFGYKTRSTGNVWTLWSITFRISYRLVFHTTLKSATLSHILLVSLLRTLIVITLHITTTRFIIIATRTFWKFYFYLILTKLKLSCKKRELVQCSILWLIALSCFN